MVMVSSDWLDDLMTSYLSLFIDCPDFFLSGGGLELDSFLSSFSLDSFLFLLLDLARGIVEGSCVDYITC